MRIVDQALMSYFNYLLNQESARAGLASPSEIRASYGHFTPTLADILTHFRVSVGSLDPAYGEVFMEALFRLDQEIGKLNPGTIEQCSL